MMGNITVIVDKTAYESDIYFDREASGTILASIAGTYQVLCGVPADQRHVTITIQDIATDEIISTTGYPNSDMLPT